MENMIEVSPAMAEAGAAIILDIYECAITNTAPRVAERIFEAMLAARQLEVAAP